MSESILKKYLCVAFTYLVFTNTHAAYAALRSSSDEGRTTSRLARYCTLPEDAKRALSSPSPTIQNSPTMQADEAVSGDHLPLPTDPKPTVQEPTTDDQTPPASPESPSRISALSPEYVPLKLIKTSSPEYVPLKDRNNG